MAEPAPKSGLERAQERIRFGLAVVGRRAVDFAREHGFGDDWDACEIAMRRALAATGLTGQAATAVVVAGPQPAPEPDAEPDTGKPAEPGTEEEPEPPARPPQAVQAGTSPAAVPTSISYNGHHIVLEKAARSLMQEVGVDAMVLIEFLGGRGTGRFGNITEVDVRRYLGS